MGIRVCEGVRGEAVGAVDRRGHVGGVGGAPRACGEERASCRRIETRVAKRVGARQLAGGAAGEGGPSRRVENERHSRELVRVEDGTDDHGRATMRTGPRGCRWVGVGQRRALSE